MVYNDVELPKIKKYKSKLLTQEQTRILIKHISGKRYETEITLALALGLRRGEILGIRISDIDFDNHVLTICNQVTTNKVKDTSTADKIYYGLKCVKTECSNRELCISEPIEKLLKKKIMYNDMQKHIFKEDYHDYDLICCKDNGEPMSPQTVYHAFKRILKECNLPDIRFHDLRHIYATICIDKNIPVKVLSQALGHSSTAVTDRVYADSIQKKRELPDIICSAINLND